MRLHISELLKEDGVKSGTLKIYIEKRYFSLQHTRAFIGLLTRTKSTEIFGLFVTAFKAMNALARLIHGPFMLSILPVGNCKTQPDASLFLASGFWQSGFAVSRTKGLESLSLPLESE